jgi:hypothetical protein
MIPELFKLIFKGLKALFILVFRKKKKTLIYGEIGTHEELQKKYNLYAENRPEIKLNPNDVPTDLSDLIPLAEKWGIGDDIIRNDYQVKASQSEKEELKSCLKGRLERINEWLDSYTDGIEMSNEAAAFMYMTLCLDEMALVLE